MIFKRLINRFVPIRSAYNAIDWIVGDVVTCNTNVDGQFSKGTKYRISRIIVHSASDIIIHIEADDSGNPNGWVSDYFNWHGEVENLASLEA